MAYQKVTVIGASEEGFTAAAADAISRAEERFGAVTWAETRQRGVELATVDRPVYQVEAEVAFEVE